MKAIIAKDNNFNTIGLEVKSKDNKNTLFAWGVCPQVEWHFVKEIEVDDFEIIRLVELNTKLAQLNRFLSRSPTIPPTQHHRKRCLEKRQGRSYGRREVRIG